MEENKVSGEVKCKENEGVEWRRRRRTEEDRKQKEKKKPNNVSSFSEFAGGEDKKEEGFLFCFCFGFLGLAFVLFCLVCEWVLSS